VHLCTIRLFLYCLSYVMADQKNKILHWLYCVEDTGRIISIITMTGLVFYQVVARLFFQWSSPAMEESARFIMIWSIFIGAVVTTREDSHIKMGAIFKGPRGKVWFECLSKVIALIFLCVFVVWSYEYAAYSLRKGMSSIVLGVPLIVVHSCFLVTGTLMVLHTIIHLIDRIKQVIGLYRPSSS
jgi:TRAP-type C4-dicarboxylate transport system permease small subunit